MPYAKYHISYKDAFNREVEVFLIQEAVVITPIELVGDENPVTITHAGEDGDIFQTMISSKATIRIILPESGSELFEDIATMDENTFGVVITVKNGLITEYIWNGWLVPDEQVKTFSYYSQNIVLTAIDAISRLKGQKLLNADETYITGVQSLKYLAQRCFDDVYTPENTLIGYTFVIKSKMVLNTNSTTVFPDILEQLAVSAEAFNDDMGRPISAFDVISKIANSLFMRCFYENGNIYFVDILDFCKDPTTPQLPVFYKEFPGVDPEADIILIENTENIDTTRTYRESRVRFAYNAMVGLLKDGFLNNWENFGGGKRLVDWVYNDLLLSQPDVYDRRVGTGRQESPFGILLKWGDPVDGPEMIGGSTGSSVSGGSTLSLDVKLEAINQGLIPLQNTAYDIDIPITFLLSVLIYNPLDPVNSLALTRVDSADGTSYTAWKFRDLTGSDFASGSFDFNDFEVGKSILLDRTSNVQTATIELPIVPESVSGQAFVAVTAITHNDNLATVGYEAHDTIIYEVLLTQKPKNTEKKTTKGEITYLSRKIRTSQEFLLRDIELHTSANFTVAGSLSSAIPYELFGYTIPPGPIGNISFEGYPGLLGFGVPLIAYCAFAQMWLNYPQYKVECEIRGRDNEFYKGIDFSCFNDLTRPSTAIYNNIFVQTSSQYELKAATRKITAISMKLNERNISDSILDDDNDLWEYYFIT